MVTFSGFVRPGRTVVTAAWKVGISPKSKAKAPAVERPSPRSSEFRRLGRQVAALALVRTSQNGRLNVRQSEELRRALTECGEVLRWAEVTIGSDEPIDVISDELGKLVKSGVRVIERELEDDLKDKKTEMKRLQAVADKARKLAESKNPKLPTEVSYSHTARAAAQGLITKTEVVIVTEIAEAESCANTIEKSMRRWESLRDQMVDELKKKRSQLATMADNIPEFVKSQRTTLREVLAVLH